MNITITGNQARAALANAAKSDVRYYLNGIYFDVDNKRLVATNGHHMYITPIEVEEHAANFIVERFAVAANVNSLTFEYVDADSPINVSMITSKGVTTSQYLHIIKGNYPNYERVIPVKNNNDTDKIKECYFDASYLALIEKTYGKNTQCKIEFNGEGRSILVSEKGNDSKLVIMPQTKESYDK